MLELKNVNYSIKNKKILKNINFRFENRKIYVLIGANGSGKTSLVKLLMGIIPNNSGQILFNNKNISNFSVSQRARLKFAMAFQQPVKFKELTVKKLFELACDKNKNLANYCNLLSKVGLCAREYVNRCFDDSLSGGERKRIEIALTLARNASVNIFDEPEAGIDLWSYDNLIKILKNLKKTSCNIIISHQEKIMEIADEIIVLDNSCIEHIQRKDIKSFLEKNTCQKLQKESL